LTAFTYALSQKQKEGVLYSDFENLDLSQESAFDVAEMAFKEAIKLTNPNLTTYNPNYNSKIIKKAKISLIKYCSMPVQKIYKEINSYKNSMSNMKTLENFYLSYIVHIKSQDLYIKTNDVKYQKLYQKSYKIFKNLRHNLNNTYIDVVFNTQ